MPKRHIRFQNKQGDWKTRKQGFIGSRLGVKLTKSQRRMLRQQQRTSKSSKAISSPRVQVQSTDVTISQIGKKKQKARSDVTTSNSEESGVTLIIQEEESSRYTPTKTVTIGEQLPDGTTQISKIGGRQPRIVSQTRVSTVPPSDKQAYILELEDDFKKWDTLPRGKEKSDSRLAIKELRILADSRNVKTAGIRRPTLEQRIRKSLG